MITSDQPNFHTNELVVALSSLDDGNMRAGFDEPGENASENNIKFLNGLGIKRSQATWCCVTYNTENFTRYHVLDKPIPELESDALVTNKSGQAIFLPLADCLGAVLYDKKQKVLMVSHLGRQSTEQGGASLSVEFVINTFNSDPKNIDIWLSPSPSAEHYPLWSFENRSLLDVNTEQFMQAGILKENIIASKIDNTVDDNYFSHSYFLKGDKSRNGRFMIVAMIR